MFSELLETCMLWSFFKFQLNFDPAKEILKYDLRFIFFIQKNHSEENASASEDFYSTILQPFQFEPERKKTVDNEKEATQAVVSRNSLKWMFLKISHHRKMLVLESLLIKFQAWRSATLLKRDSNTGVFLWNLQYFWEHVFLQNTSGGYFWN